MYPFSPPGGTHRRAAKPADAYRFGADGGSGEALGLRRSPDDLFFIYTGTTTGMPKGVMWRQEALRRALINPALTKRVQQGLADHLQIVQQTGQGPTCLSACPLMHGTGVLSGITVLVNAAGFTLRAKHFDADELWDAVHRMFRAPNGKADYKRARQSAQEALQGQSA